MEAIFGINNHLLHMVIRSTSRTLARISNAFGRATASMWLRLRGPDGGLY